MGFSKSTHCKNCNEEFEVSVERAGSHALCKECYKEKQRKRNGYYSREKLVKYKESKGEQYYEAIQLEMAQLQSREEWLKSMGDKLEKAIEELYGVN